MTKIILRNALNNELPKKYIPINNKSEMISKGIFCLKKNSVRKKKRTVPTATNIFGMTVNKVFGV
jgi:hypothetical protein